MDPISCPSCGARFPVSKFDEADRAHLSDQRTYDTMLDEQQMLLRVQSYYHRHPQVEGQIEPDFMRMLSSDDPHIQEQLAAGVPFDRIAFQDASAIAPPVESPEDAEVVEYLRHNSFDLRARLEFVSERVADLAKSVRKVACLHCVEGALRVRTEDWNAFTGPDSISWYWPEWHGFDENGELTIKTSGYQGDAHWSGVFSIEPNNADYAFWKWLVKQPQHYRLVQDDELPAIRDEFTRGRWQ